MTTQAIPTTKLPGWPELAVALTIYVVGVVLLGLWITQVPDEQTLFRINVAGAANFTIGLTALIVAYLMRVRAWPVFGFRPTTARWLVLSGGLGVVAFGLSFLIEAVYFHFVTEPNTQADFQLAAKSGALSLALLLFTGAVLGPIGEELVFRGVIASALDRYGAWVAVLGSAALFAVVHGPSVILLDAFMVGILTGIVFRMSGSIWPAIVLRVVYNGLHILAYSAL